MADFLFNLNFVLCIHILHAGREREGRMDEGRGGRNPLTQEQLCWSGSRGNGLPKSLESPLSVDDICVGSQANVQERDQGSLIFPKCLNWLHFYAESHISSDTLLLTSALV